MARQDLGHRIRWAFDRRDLFWTFVAATLAALAALVAMVGGFLSLDEGGQDPSVTTVPVDPVPLIYTASCRIDDIEVVVPGRIYVGEPFYLDVSTSERPLASCPVSAALSDDGGKIVLGEPRLELDLMHGQLNWLAVAEEPGPHTLFLSISSTEPCIDRCRVPEQLPVRFVADRDSAYQEARLALESFVSDLDAKVDQVDALTPGVSGLVGLTVSVREPSELEADFDEVSLTVSSTSDEIHLPAGHERRIDLSRSDDAELRWTFVAKTVSPHNFAALLDFELVGVHDDDVIIAEDARSLTIDVREEGWFQRYVVSPLGIVGTVVVVIGGIVGIIAGIRKLLRDEPGRTPPAMTPPDP